MHERLRPAEGVCVASLWAGDGVARGYAVPGEDVVERVLFVVWLAVEVGVSVQEVVAFADVLDGDRGVLVGHGQDAADGEHVAHGVAVDVHALAGFLVNENGVLVCVEVVAGADPHFTHLCERGALGRAVGRFGEGDTRTCGGVCPHGAVVADGDGNVFVCVGGRRDAGREVYQAKPV